MLDYIWSIGDVPAGGRNQRPKPERLYGSASYVFLVSRHHQDHRPSQRMFVAQGSATCAFGLIAHHQGPFGINQDRPSPRAQSALERLSYECGRRPLRAVSSAPATRRRRGSRRFEIQDRGIRQTIMGVKNNATKLLAFRNRTKQSRSGPLFGLGRSDTSETCKSMYALLWWSSPAIGVPRERRRGWP